LESLSKPLLGGETESSFWLAVSLGFEKKSACPLPNKEVRSVNLRKSGRWAEGHHQEEPNGGRVLISYRPGLRRGGHFTVGIRQKPDLHQKPVIRKKIQFKKKKKVDTKSAERKRTGSGSTGLDLGVKPKGGRAPSQEIDLKKRD